MKETILLKINGEELLVTGIYIQNEKGDYYTPSIGSKFEISKIYYKDVDVTDLIYATSNIDFEELCINEIKCCL